MKSLRQEIFSSKHEHGIGKFEEDKRHVESRAMHTSVSCRDLHMFSSVISMTVPPDTNARSPTPAAWDAQSTPPHCLQETHVPSFPRVPDTRAHHPRRLHGRRNVT